ncbi:2TM domain-containing protein [Flagellimonas sp. DF-77]|uniref:2TM domain-containing protein n=1 Tax=Flagellimonas algarum TaxID=3230298 RepID=UPI003399360B
MTMDQNNINEFRRQRAEERVKSIKGFYQHLTAYIIVNTVLLIFSGQFRFILISEELLGNQEFMDWINWNVWGTPIVWGIFLLIHGVSVFAKSPFKKWEERQIRKIIREESAEIDKFERK